MVTYVLDASAILRYLDGEAGAERVKAILKAHLAEECGIAISAIHWGEVAGIVFKRHGRAKMDTVLARLSAFGFEVVPATEQRAVRSALVKAERRIPYADAFGIELAGDSTEHVLITADFDAKAAEGDVRIEFLPVK
ncbi:MAG TPA: PIN domain-containing protein [Edaphobacter sp.]|nr:PIN domain-containing protein [Edaphobacter sp.]